MTNKDLKTGIVYSDGDVIFQCKEGYKGIGLRASTWAFETNNYFNTNDKNLKPADSEECLWLEACIKANKFIPKEEVMKQTENKSALGSLVGRYLKCIKENYWKDGTKPGNFFKIVEEGSQFVWTEGFQGYSLNKDRFTRDGEFELMPEGFEPKAEAGAWEPKVGNWVYLKDNGCRMAGTDLAAGVIGQLKESDKMKGYDYSFVLNKVPIGYNQGETNRWLRPATTEEIASVTGTKPQENTQKKTKRELLIEARERYPIGTRVKVVHLNNVIGTVTSHESISSDKMDDECDVVIFKGTAGDHYSMAVYEKGNWAVVVSKPESPGLKQETFQIELKQESFLGKKSRFTVTSEPESKVKLLKSIKFLKIK